MAGEQTGNAALGAAIRRARERIGWPQARLAQDIGFGQRWMSAVETGMRGVNVHDLAKIATVLGTSVDELLGLAAPAEDEGEFLSTMRRYALTLDERGRRTVLRVAAAQVEEAGDRAAAIQRVLDDPEATATLEALLAERRATQAGESAAASRRATTRPRRA